MKRLLILILFIAFIAVVKCNETPSDKADCSDLTAVIKPEEKETFKLYRETSTGKLYLSTPKGSNSGVIMGNILPIIDVETIDNYDCSQITYIAIDEKGNLYRKEDVKLMPAEINHTDTPEPVCKSLPTENDFLFQCPWCEKWANWQATVYNGQLCPHCNKQCTFRAYAGNWNILKAEGNK